MNSVYSNEERVFIIKTFYSGNCLRIVRDLFAVKFPNRPIPSATTIRAYVQKFESTASVAAENSTGKFKFEYFLRDLQTNHIFIYRK